MRHRLSVEDLNTHGVNNFLRINWGPEAVGTVWIEVAPLVDSKFTTVKAIYDRILANPDVVKKEYNNIDIDNMREELSIPTEKVGEAEVDLSKPMLPNPFQKDDDSKGDDGE